jgi:DNA polymerase-4
MTLPTFDQSAPFRWLFLDLNAYFASVEQQANPSLRGRPVAVVQVESDNSCVIAASYEAKRTGVYTGCTVADAKRLCPDIQLVRANHKRYVEFHDQVVASVETVLPVDKVLSIDELRIRLLASEATAAVAKALALQIKDAIYDRVGECLHCSIGIAPNAFLAKIGTELEKPNGLVLLLPTDLEDKIGHWKLSALPGINRRMTVRLNLSGIYTISQLLRASDQQLREAFGSVIGVRWYHLLRGADLPDIETRRRTLSHEHVLPPEFRTLDGCYAVMQRLTEKAAARLRREGYAARTVEFSVRGRKSKWEAHIRFGPTMDTMSFLDALRQEWPKNDITEPIKAGVVLQDLVPAGQLSLSLFDSDNNRVRLSKAADSMNKRFGKHAVVPGGVWRAKNSAPERIAFQKTSLFDEGREVA